ncbi:type VII toxin-antitoxin system HepT family RNase toxin [Planococcus lenghuensis]|uniref:DUF86 domain-containing protein n=1 Tax=Planococcus lenghuensis TaxID=2213202 RepID=A0A1Q2KYQ5_9BACL|nr:DUF86 domain-containing protein [Planococcus lenghuensis]AQQ53355.1 hypothetical protein B0X71_09875 [Planococcus lenghuensis]
MRNDVILSKINIIERCLKRIHEVYEGNPGNLMDFTKQDSIVLNIQRACEASIDLSMHIVAEKRLGIPQTSRDAFELLQQNQIISTGTTKQMKAMVGFRNVAVHNYEEISMVILQKVIELHLADLRKFTEEILSYQE